MTIKNLISSTTFVRKCFLYSTSNKFDNPTRKTVAYSHFIRIHSIGSVFTISTVRWSKKRIFRADHRLCVTHSEDRHEIFLVQIFTDTEFFRTIILIYVNLRYFMQIPENQIYINLFWIVGGEQRFIFKYHFTIYFL